VGESLIRYTEEVVLPRLDASLAELDAGVAAAGPPGRAREDGGAAAAQGLREAAVSP
jgi:hypothetical protein